MTENSSMWSISEVKRDGRRALKTNYWGCVLAALILSILTTMSALGGSAGSTSSLENYTQQLGLEEMEPFFDLVAAYFFIYVIVWGLLRVFLLNILEVGCHSFLKKSIDSHAMFDEFKVGFGNYKRTMLTMMLRDVFLGLWYCLLVIPGVVKSYSYMLVPYIITDEPELTPMEAIKKSCAMMKGHKWQAFVLDLSYIGWMILSLITFRLLGVFYVEPYRRCARAAIYRELRKNGR